MAAQIDRYGELIKIILDGHQKMLGPEASRLDAARAAHDRTAENYGKSYAKSQNPIWAWRCITALRTLCVYASRECPELRAQTFVRELPDWCLAYLVESAYRIECLSGLRDFEKPGAMDGHRMQFQGPVDLEPEHAAAMVPRALGFVRDGWNAFSRYAADFLPRLYLDVREVEKLAGRKPSFKLRELTEMLGVSDARAALRRVAKVKKGVAKPTK
ncbi:hypothetical protein [Elioraea rosea]|uniref:hypothetical protein n=1 Tax=Elioraea rosea TaxID=2492390 RepID=UPI0011833BA0|nr:hypothetical protein [Elioraea rosea]